MLDALFDNPGGIKLTITPHNSFSGNYNRKENLKMLSGLGQ